MIRTISKLIAVAALAISATGCAVMQHQQPSNGVAEFGVVLQAQEASVASRNQEVGIAAVGGLLGTALGNLLSKDKSWSTRATAMSLGGSVGAMAGNVAAKATGTTKGQMLIVLNGDLQKLAITQPIVNNEMLAAGDPVYIIRQGGEMRATKMQANDPMAAAFISGLKGTPLKK